MGDFVGLRKLAGREIKTPRFDTAIPIAPRKREVFDRFTALTFASGLGGTGADKIGLNVAFIAIARRSLRRNSRHLGDALGIGFRQRNFFTGAIGNAHGGIRNGFTFIQSGNPRQRIFTPQLEMHAQIRHQGGCAHVHLAVFAVFGVKQMVTELARCDFQHMEARRQRNAHHFKRARVAAGGLGQFLRGNVVAFFRIQQRNRTAFYAFHGVVLVLTHFQKPLNDVGIGSRAQNFDFTFGQIRQERFDIAQRNRQHRDAIGFGETLDHAKWCGGKLRQRWHGTGGNLKRRIADGQSASGIVFEIRRKFNREAGFFGEHIGEGNIAFRI